MLLLGVLQAQAAGAGPAGAGSFDLLETQVLASAEASVVFDNLDTLAAGYQHLQIRGAVRTDNSDVRDDITIKINAITNSYAYHTLFGNGSSVVSGEDSPSKAFMRIFYGASGATATANAFGAFVMDVLDFSSSSKNTTIRALAGSPSTAVSLNSGLTNNTAAVTSITLDQLTGSNFVTGSRFSIYGLKVSA